MDFLKSDIALRMKAAYKDNKLKREQPFVMADEKGRLIQGIIDAYFIENEEIVLVDYKTDYVQNESELIKKYSVQLEYYARALEKINGRSVKDKIIYSTHLNKCLKV